MNASTLRRRRFEREAVRDEAGAGLSDVLAAKRRRLGSALHELAIELARERRRNAELEREVRRLRGLLDRAV